MHSGLPHSRPTAQISTMNNFLFWTPYLQPDQSLLQFLISLQFSIISKRVFSSPTVSLSMPCRTSCTHCSNFPRPISLLLFPSIFWEKNLNVPITRQRLSQHELRFVPSHQLFSRNVNTLAISMHLLESKYL